MRKTVQQSIAVIVSAVLFGCTAGPNYERPSVAVPTAYRELKGWKEAEPRDHELTAAWWKVFGDPL